MFERRLSDGSVSKDRVEVVVDSTLPAHIRQENFWNSAFKEHDPSEHDSKIKIRQEQRALGQTLETRRALLRSTDMNLKDIPYVFDELLKRTRPEYQRQKGFQKNIQALPNILSETSALAGLFVRTHEVLDMETWDSVRFPKSILSYSEEGMVYSTTTAREKLLNPKYRKVITYKKTKIDQISVNEIGLGQTSEFLIPSKPSEPRHYADRYRNYVSGLFLAEVQGLPMIVSAPLKTMGSKPVWSESLLELYTFWELMNPDIPFVIGEDQEGKFRVVFPMFKIISPFNGDRLDGESWPKINEALVNAETHFLDDLSFRVDSENAKLAIMLSNNFVISDFGHLGLRFSHFSRQQAGITNRGGRYFDPFIPGDFSYFNIVRAHLMTWMNPDERASALDHLIERNQYNDWFESVFWLSQSEIVFSQRKDFRNYNSMNYEILSGQSAQLIAKGWLSGKSLLRHFEKHGVLEMGFESDSEYLEAAKEFLESEDPRQMVIKRLNSSTRIKYNFMTKEFAIVDPDGLIISYYRLTEDYRSKEEFHEYLGSNIVKR